MIQMIQKKICSHDHNNSQITHALPTRCMNSSNLVIQYYKQTSTSTTYAKLTYGSPLIVIFSCFVFVFNFSVFTTLITCGFKDTSILSVFYQTSEGRTVKFTPKQPTRWQVNMHFSPTEKTLATVLQALTNFTKFNRKIGVSEFIIN